MEPNVARLNTFHTSAGLLHEAGSPGSFVIIPVKRVHITIAKFCEPSYSSSHPHTHMCKGSKEGSKPWRGLSPGAPLVHSSDTGLEHPSSSGSITAFQVLGNISQDLFICFDFCTLSKLKTSAKRFLDCKYGPRLVCLCVILLLEESPRRI